MEPDTAKPDLSKPFEFYRYLCFGTRIGLLFLSLSIFAQSSSFVQSSYVPLVSECWTFSPSFPFNPIKSAFLQNIQYYFLPVFAAGVVFTAVSADVFQNAPKKQHFLLSLSALISNVTLVTFTLLGFSNINYKNAFVITQGIAAALSRLVQMSAMGLLRGGFRVSICLMFSFDALLKMGWSIWQICGMQVDLAYLELAYAAAAAAAWFAVCKM